SCPPSTTTGRSSRSQPTRRDRPTRSDQPASSDRPPEPSSGPPGGSALGEGGQADQVVGFGVSNGVVEPGQDRPAQRPERDGGDGGGADEVHQRRTASRAGPDERTHGVGEQAVGAQQGVEDLAG